MICHIQVERKFEKHTFLGVHLNQIPLVWWRKESTYKLAKVIYAMR